MTNNGLFCTVYTSLDDLEKLRPDWERMARHPNSQYDHFRTVIASEEGKIAPYVMAFSGNDGVIAIVAARTESFSIPVFVGYKRFWTFSVKAIVVVYNGMLGEITREVVEALFLQSKSCFESGLVDLVFFNYTVVDSPIYCLLAEKRRNGFYSFYGNQNLHWYLDGLDRPHDFIGSLSGKFKKNLNRAKRKLWTSGDVKAEIRRYTTPESVGEFLDCAEEIAARSYQRGLGVGFVKNRRETMLTLEAARLGWLHSYVLSIDNRPVAFEKIYLYKDILYCQDAAYDANYREYEPGTNLFLRIIEEAAAEKIIREIDFGFGDAEYKHRFGNGHRVERTLCFFKRSGRNLLIMVLLKMTRDVNQKIRSLAMENRAVKFIRSQWRRWLTPKSQQ